MAIPAGLTLGSNASYATGRMTLSMGSRRNAVYIGGVHSAQVSSIQFWNSPCRIGYYCISLGVGFLLDDARLGVLRFA